MATAPVAVFERLAAAEVEAGSSTRCIATEPACVAAVVAATAAACWRPIIRAALLLVAPWRPKRLEVAEAAPAVSFSPRPNAGRRADATDDEADAELSKPPRRPAAPWLSPSRRPLAACCCAVAATEAPLPVVVPIEPAFSACPKPGWAAGSFSCPLRRPGRVAVVVAISGLPTRSVRPAHQPVPASVASSRLAAATQRVATRRRR